jgi:hypothetical protein
MKIAILIDNIAVFWNGITLKNKHSTPVFY